ncbi:MAG: DMT family transporter [Rhodospirillales bacterium]|nr:DMT family transporter [Rhodospirillales bacterium]
MRDNQTQTSSGRPVPAIEDGRAVRVAFVALMCGAFAIAFSPIFVRLSELDPTATAFHRVFLAWPALWLWSAMPAGKTGTARQPASRKDYWVLMLSGVFFAGDLAFWHWSIRYTSVANSTLLANFAPIFVSLGAFVLFRERFSRTFLVGMVCALAGACVLMGDSFVLSLTNLLGDALGMITAVFYGAYILTVGRLRAHFSTATIMAWSSGTAAVILLPVTLASGEALIPGSLYGWGILLGLALFSHAGGQSLIAYALAHLPAAFSSVSLLFQPAISAVLAWVILNEPLGAVQALGGAIILVGIYLARRGSR